jgi:hypothetical protein
LTSGRVYEFRISGVIAGGFGDVSSIVTAGPGVPNAPTGVTAVAQSTTGSNQASLTINWTRLSTANLNFAKNPEYIIQYRLGGTAEWVSSPRVSSSI